MEHYKWVDPTGKTAFPIAKPGYRYIIAAVFVTVILSLTGIPALTLLALATTAFICWFFRDPDRPIPVEDGAVVSPADGKVIVVGPVENSLRGKEPSVKISIFMSVFNVHVNRAPCSGTVDKILYYPGTFFSADLDKASEKNERNALYIQTDGGEKICVVQVAGLVARRIICDVAEGDTVEQGQRFGMICFGSRLDLYLPVNAKAAVKIGDKVQAGTSILAYMK